MMLRKSACLAGVLVFTACSSGSSRHSVRWESLEVSDDGRQLTVTASYPVGASCAKSPDGLDVETSGGTAIVTFWFRGDDDEICTAECGVVTQTADLTVPLDDIDVFEAPDDAEQGCW